MTLQRWMGRACLGATVAAALALGGFAAPARAAGPADQGPIKIGVISEQSAIVGQSISEGAALAIRDINAKGGVNGRKLEMVLYDDHSSAAEAVRAFQRAAEQDHVQAIVVTFLSEVALAVEPWAARLHMPTITPGAASDLISGQVHDHYARFKYMFDGWLNSQLLAEAVCQSSHALFVERLHMNSAAIMSEDADWTKPLDAGYETCLPKAGLRLTDVVRFNPDTTDFTPIFDKIEATHPDVIITGIGHVGVQPTVQWHAQQVPLPMGGVSAQATNPVFWKDTNGAADGVITQSGLVPGLALTPRTLPVAEEFRQKYGRLPAYDGFTAYDEVWALAQAMQRAHSTAPDAIVAQMEKTHMVGTLGTYGFYGRADQFTHSLRFGKDWIRGVFLQWQDGKQVCVWPTDECPNQLHFPAFLKTAQMGAK
jgi:branched-chain amino acid transport system substrate-binding protein